jgi:hypothetical protein
MKQLSTHTLYLFLCLFGCSNNVFSQNKGPLTDYDLLFKKGTTFVGLAGSANFRGSTNENALVFTIVDQEKQGYSITGTSGRFLKEDFAIGIAFDYERNSLERQTIDADNITSDIKEEAAKLTASVYGKQFISLFPSKRINLFNIYGLAWVNDSKLNETRSQGILTRTFTESNAINFGISPGIQVFVIDGFATEVGVNVAGITAGRTTTYLNNVEDASINNFKIDLKINILSLNIGFYYYFLTNTNAR